MKKPRFLKLSPREREALRRRVTEKALTEDDHEILEELIDFYFTLQQTTRSRALDESSREELVRKLLGGEP